MNTCLFFEGEDTNSAHQSHDISLSDMEIEGPSTSGIEVEMEDVLLEREIESASESEREDKEGVELKNEIQTTRERTPTDQQQGTRRSRERTRRGGKEGNQEE